jgi:hypothetical protein
MEAGECMTVRVDGVAECVFESCADHVLFASLYLGGLAVFVCRCLVVAVESGGVLSF